MEGGQRYVGVIFGCQVLVYATMRLLFALWRHYSSDERRCRFRDCNRLVTHFELACFEVHPRCAGSL